MDDLSSVISPGVAIVLSVATFIFTQIRAQQIDSRSAAKDTVDVLIAQNKMLLEDITSLRMRLDQVEVRRTSCEERLIEMSAQLVALQAQRHG